MLLFALVIAVMVVSVSSLQLLSPIKLGSLCLSNRVVMAPLTRSRAGLTRVPNDFMRQYYEQRASAGLIISEAVAISDQGYGWYGAPALYTEEHALGWKKIVHAVHDKGSKMFAQLWHMGRLAHSSFHEVKEIVAPSAIPVPGDVRIRDINYVSQSYEVPRALSTKEIPDIVHSYRKSAELAQLAGFDGVEVHAANGYLLDTFLQSCSNHRFDIYGGSRERRFRILREVIEAVAEVYPTDRIGVRFSPNRSGKGMGSVDNHIMFPYVAEQLEPYGLAYLHVMDGLSLEYHKKCPPVTLYDMKRCFGGPIIGNIAFTRDTAEGAIRTGAADLIAFGKPYISNPDLVERFENNWPLNPDAPPSVYYCDSPDPAKCLHGYLDFPRYSPPSSQ